MTAVRARRRPRGEPEITIEREACETDYTVLPNAIARDQRLKPVPGFVLYYILAKPPNWKVVPSEIGQRMGLKLPAMRKALAALIKLGYGKRELVRDENQRIIGTRYFFASWPKYDSDESRAGPSAAPAARAIGGAAGTDTPAETSAGDAVLHFSVSRQSRATEKATPVLSNDSNKPPPQSPPIEDTGSVGEGIGAAAGGREYAAAPPLSEQAHRTETPRTTDPPPGGSGSAAHPAAGATSGTAGGSAGKAPAQNAPPDPLKPVTFADFWREYEPHRHRNRDKAVDAWDHLDDAKRLHAYSVMPQYFGHMGSIRKKPEEAWRYLRLGLFRGYQLPSAPRDPKEAPVREPPPDPDAVLAGPLGLRAAEGRWVLELVEFIERNRRIPDEIECGRLADTGGMRHRQLVADESAVAAGTMIAPTVGVFLGKRRRLIEKALRMHGRAVELEGREPGARNAARADHDDFADIHYGRQ